MRTHSALRAIGFALFLATPSVGPALAADPVSLLPYGQEPARDAANANGSWMVCGFKHEGSFLSLRQRPSTKSRELERLRALTLISSAGKTRGGGAWIKVNNIGTPFAEDGTFRTNEDDWNRRDVTGWVATRYLCHYGPLPYPEN